LRQTRNQLVTPGVAKSLLRAAQSFLNYVQHICPGGRKVLQGASPLKKVLVCHKSVQIKVLSTFAKPMFMIYLLLFS